MQIAVLVLAATVTACGRVHFDPLDTTDALDPATLVFEPAVPIDTVNSATSDDDPTITGDLLEIVFDSARNGPSGDLFVTLRVDTASPWSIPVIVTELSTSTDEDSPWVSQDGLSITLASGRAGGGGALDLYLASRLDRESPWSTPVHVPELASAASELDLAVSADRLWAVFASDREGGAGGFDLYATSRALPSEPWGQPRRLDELATPADDLDPVLDGSGTVMVFSSDRDGDSDIYITIRAAPDAPFAPPFPLASVNTSGEETDPSLAPDFRTIVFTRGAGVDRDLYIATRP